MKIKTIQLKTVTFWCVILLLLIGYHHNTSAQILIDTNNFQYTQNFNSLGIAEDNPWTNNVTLTGWYAASSEEGYYTSYRSSNAVTNSGIYSYGVDADRALGSITNQVSMAIVFGALFQNNSGVMLNSVQLTFDAEHWHRSETNLLGHQRTKVSYVVGSPVSIAASDLFTNNAFIDLPEAYLISVDTLRTDAQLNGNDNAVTISVSFPVSIDPGEQFFIRFFDEDTNFKDLGLAVDNLSITFSSAVVPRIVANSGYTIFSYLDMGIVQDIPDQTFGYIIPDEDVDVPAWQQILDNFFSNNLDIVNVTAYGYEAVEFTDESGREFVILRKQNHSLYFWGTYVKALNPTNTVLCIQSPHAVDDANTGRQGAAVFHHTDASAFMLSGISRCATNTPSDCDGQTTACSPSNQPFKLSDVPHADNSIYHIATVTLATQIPSLVFVQLHGFSPSGSEPDFIISCGVASAMLKSVPDYPVLVRENLLTTNPTFDVQLVHVDSYPDLRALDNVQGRYLNLYPGDICSGQADPLSATNRFLHIEQFSDYRKYASYYLDLANAIGLAINPNPYVSAVAIENTSDTYTQNFDGLHTPGTTHTWGNNLHLPGWYAVRSVGGLLSSYRINHGSLSTGGLYSAGSTNSSDRALGSLSTTSSVGNTAYGMLFRNETGVTIYSVTLNYRAEQWRATNEPTHRVQLGYRIDDKINLHPTGILTNNFTNVPAGDLVSIDNGQSTGALDGNSNAVWISNLTIPIVLNPDQELFLRFYDPNDPGFDKLMAVDDFSASFSSVLLLVDWKYFNIIKKNGRPVLQWGAEKENSCNRYEILRSEDGKYFESIGVLPCKQKGLVNSYEFTDYSQLWNNVYYKIAQFDHNGEVTFSPIRSFSPEKVAEPSVTFVNGEIVIQWENEASLLDVSVLDYMGREFCHGTPSQDSKGNYSLSCIIDRNQLVIVRLTFDSFSYVTHMRVAER